MLFNSLEFLIFLPLVFILYWALHLRSYKSQNVLLLIASYIFYGWWDWRFLGLILLSSIIDYILGLRIHSLENQRSRRLLLWLSLGVNLGLLGTFKYLNFFIDSFASLLSQFGLQPNVPSLNIILPVGISFYTFQTLSYTIDIYRRKIEPTNDMIAFFTFVGFFPQLVAGPIERAASLLPQFLKSREFDLRLVSDGMRQILWGFFKKIVIADNVAQIVNLVFKDYAMMSGSDLALGTFLFAIQIYCDFSGYSDIAIGTARLLGFDLMRNFAYPYFSRNIGEFWRRWHISLSSWFRDYVYIPLGGSFTSKPRQILNLILTFTISGFWHGANWTFIVWGALNGLYYIPFMLLSRNRKTTGIVAQGAILPSLSEFGLMIITFVMTLLAWIFFRAESITHALKFIHQMFTSPWNTLSFELPILLSLILLGVEWVQRSRPHALQIDMLAKPLRWAIYICVIFTILSIGHFEKTAFIYFQF